jgi:hypothetical protein
MYIKTSSGYSEWIPSASSFEMDTGNKLPEIIPLVTHIRLLDKARCVGTSIGLGFRNGRTLPHVQETLTF